LVDEPHDLVRVTDRVRRKLGRDYQVDRRPLDLLEVEQAPGERLSEDARARIPLEGHGDELRLVTPAAQLVDERLGEDLGPAARERHLRVADKDSHRSAAAEAEDAEEERGEEDLNAENDERGGEDCKPFLGQLAEALLAPLHHDHTDHDEADEHDERAGE
jgi:hypothetical protein